MHTGVVQLQDGEDDNRVEKLYYFEELRVKLVNAGIGVGDDTLYSCFINDLPSADYALKLRDLNIKQV